MSEHFHTLFVVLTGRQQLERCWNQDLIQCGFLLIQPLSSLPTLICVRHLRILRAWANWLHMTHPCCSLTILDLCHLPTNGLYCPFWEPINFMSHINTQLWHKSIAVKSSSRKDAPAGKWSKASRRAWALNQMTMRWAAMTIFQHS